MPSTLSQRAATHGPHPSPHSMGAGEPRGPRRSAVEVHGRVPPDRAAGARVPPVFEGGGRRDPLALSVRRRRGVLVCDGGGGGHRPEQGLHQDQVRRRPPDARGGRVAVLSRWRGPRRQRHGVHRGGWGRRELETPRVRGPTPPPPTDRRSPRPPAARRPTALALARPFHSRGASLTRTLTRPPTPRHAARERRPVVHGCRRRRRGWRRSSRGLRRRYGREKREGCMRVCWIDWRGWCAMGDGRRRLLAPLTAYASLLPPHRRSSPLAPSHAPTRALTPPPLSPLHGRR